MNEERWKDVKGWEGLYMVSDHGGVFSIRRGIHLKTTNDGRGYLFVGLRRAPIKKIERVHRIVASCFLESGSPEQSLVNHIDGNKANNHYTNLEWVTSSENRLHAFRIGLICHKGSNSPASKLTDNDVIKIRSLRKSGVSCKALADMFGVTDAYISMIHNRLRWKHIP